MRLAIQLRRLSLAEASSFAAFHVHGDSLAHKISQSAAAMSTLYASYTRSDPRCRWIARRPRSDDDPSADLWRRRHAIASQRLPSSQPGSDQVDVLLLDRLDFRDESGSHVDDLRQQAIGGLHFSDMRPQGILESSKEASTAPAHLLGAAGLGDSGLQTLHRRRAAHCDESGPFASGVAPIPQLSPPRHRIQGSRLIAGLLDLELFARGTEKTLPLGRLLEFQQSLLHSGSVHLTIMPGVVDQEARVKRHDSRVWGLGTTWSATPKRVTKDRGGRHPEDLWH